MDGGSISVIVPALNEAAALPELIERIDRTLQAVGAAV